MLSALSVGLLPLTALSVSLRSVSAGRGQVAVRVGRSSNLPLTTAAPDPMWKARSGELFLGVVAERCELRNQPARESAVCVGGVCDLSADADCWSHTVSDTLLATHDTPRVIAGR